MSREPLVVASVRLLGLALLGVAFGFMLGWRSGVGIVIAAIGVRLYVDWRR